MGKQSVEMLLARITNPHQPPERIICPVSLVVRGVYNGIEDMKSYLQFDEQDWARIECDWTAWWRGELDRPMVVIEAMARRRDRAGTWWDHITGFPMRRVAEA